MLPWKWRARRAVKPLRDEHRAATEALGRGSEEWLRWWRTTGERELQCILMTAWDPIGVSEAPEAWGEYDNYVPAVAVRLRDARDDDAAIEEVVDYLNHVERDFMQTLNKQHERSNRFLADTLVAWHEWSFRNGGGPPGGIRPRGRV
jgi:hypothetical protein